MLKLAILLAGGTALTLCMSAPTLAEVGVHRSHVLRHAGHIRVVRARRFAVGPRRVARVVAPATYVPLGPDEFVDPANPGYVRGVDDGSRYDTEADGVAVGREPGDLVPRDGSSRAYARSGGPGLELEGPPVYRTLPVVPELVTPELY